MANKASEYTDFASVKQRLDEIVQAVSDDEMPLDEALDLYEEAVALGMRASDLLEEGIVLAEEQTQAEADNEDAQTVSQNTAPALERANPSETTQADAVL